MRMYSSELSLFVTEIIQKDALLRLAEMLHFPWYRVVDGCLRGNGIESGKGSLPWILYD